MKKLISLALALIFVFSMATVAMATTDSPDEGPVQGPTDQATVTLTKKYQLIGAGSSPAETFTVEQTGKRVVNGELTVAPDLGTITGAEFAAGAATADGATATITINLPTYTNVGIYEYTLQEVATRATAGVTYRSNAIRLVVSVINDANGNIRVAYAHAEEVGSTTKSNTITNTYSAGSLSVKKTVTGNLGDHSKYFAITVTLSDTTDDAYGTNYTGNNITVGPTSYSVPDDNGGTITNPTTIAVGTPATFYLKHDETLTLSNIPYGTEYTVTEADLSDYTETITGGDANGTGVVDSASEDLVTVTNYKEVQVDTGITLDSLPFVLILAVCAGAVVLFVIKRRNSVEF